MGRPAPLDIYIKIDIVFEMSLDHILLGLLREPATGYDLRQEFASGAAYFWSAELSQIYPALQAMERKGWLRSRQEPSAKGPARRVYRRTPRGKKELHAWLAGEPILGAERFAYLAQLCFQGELADPEVTLRFVQQLRAKQATLLGYLQGGLDEVERAHPNDKETMDDLMFHGWMCMQLGTRAIAARIAWCDEMMELLERRSSRLPAGNGRSRRSP